MRGQTRRRRHTAHSSDFAGDMLEFTAAVCTYFTSIDSIHRKTSTTAGDEVPMCGEEPCNAVVVWVEAAGRRAWLLVFSVQR